MKLAKLYIIILILGSIIVACSVKETMISSNELFGEEVDEIVLIQVFYTQENSKHYKSDIIISKLIEKLAGLELEHVNYDICFEKIKNNEIENYVFLMNKANMLPSGLFEQSIVINFIITNEEEVIFFDIENVKKPKAYALKDKEIREDIISFIRNLN